MTDAELKCEKCGGAEFVARSDSLDIFRAKDGGLWYQKTEAANGGYDSFACAECGAELMGAEILG